MRISKSVLAFLVALLTILTCAFAAEVEPSLLDALRSESSKSVTALVRLKSRTSEHLKTLRLQDFPNRADRINVVVTSLRIFARGSQRRLLEHLENAKNVRNPQLRVEPLWSCNVVILRNADLETVLSAASFPEVDSVIGDRVYHLNKPSSSRAVEVSDLGNNEEVPRGIDRFQAPQVNDLRIEEVPWGIDRVQAPQVNDHRIEEVPWGIDRVQAPQVWRSGNKGQGIIVATVDSGVRGSHEALASNFAGPYGWYDPYGSNSQTPFDDDNHGTHVTATIAGTAHNVGVAPGAKWASCKGCITALCYLSQLLKCGEWIACPTLPDGTNEDCAQAPHVVSNSWGGRAGDDWYYDTIATYRALGIIPVFAAGNMGPKCSSVGSPSDYDNVISVGGVAIAGDLSWFTSFGPVVNDTSRTKPDFVAPATDVLSASNKADKEYLYQNGTSMACPHAAGVIALLLAEQPNLTFDQVKQVLAESAARDVASSGIACGDVPEHVFPNNHVGHGRVDAARAIEYLRARF